MRLTCVLKAMVLVGSLVGVLSAAMGWPNEPASSILLSDFNFDSKAGGGWSPVYPQGGAIVTDNTAPMSGPNVLQYTWHHNAGYGDVSVETYGLPRGTREIFIGLWWKPSNPFHGWTGNPSQKIMLLDGTRNHVYMFMVRRTPGNYNDYYLSLGLTNHAPANNCHIAGGLSCDILGPNVASPTVALGQWHKIEWYAKASTTPYSKDGAQRWWMDGQLLGTYDNVNTVLPDFAQHQIHSVWDAMETGCLTCVDYHWFDHVRLSVPNGAIPPFIITTGSLPAGASGKAYTGYLAASGGKAPYYWSISSGSLLPGLSLNKATGVISGTPTTGGKCEFTVKALDALVPPSETTKPFSIVVSGPITSISSSGYAAGSAVKVEANAGKVRLSLPRSGEGKYQLSVFDLSGKQVCRIDGADQNEINLGAALKNGIYIARLTQNGHASAARFQVME